MAAALILAGAAACTVHKQETPSLTGPSELGTSITVQVSPDVVAQNGSQSIVTIIARDANGQPRANLSMRVDVTQNGGVVESALGTLSARSVVTDGSGRATVTYTAPQMPSGGSAAGQIQIQVTPVETDFGNSTPRTATIRLVEPAGVGGGGPSCLPAKPFVFTPSTPTDHQTVVFDADQNVGVQFTWDFGDSATASGHTVSHSFSRVDNYRVTLTVMSASGILSCITQSVPVAQGQAPTAVFVVSPANPLPDQQVFFNAASSKPAAGRTITGYQWDFGDGASGSGVQASHTYTVTGGYTVMLTVTDDAGNVGTVTQTVSIGVDSPTADFTFSPAAPTAGSFVNFNGSTSQAVAGRTISTYTWNFGDGTTATGATPTHSFATAGTYNVTLTVVDNQGKSASVTKSVTVS